MRPTGVAKPTGAIANPHRFEEWLGDVEAVRAGLLLARQALQVVDTSDDRRRLINRRLNHIETELDWAIEKGADPEFFDLNQIIDYLADLPMRDHPDMGKSWSDKLAASENRDKAKGIL